MSAPFVIQTKVVGDREIVDRFKTTGDRLRTRLRETMREIGAGLKSGAQSAAAVKTGKLKRSARAKGINRAMTIGVTVGFGRRSAPMVERGYGPTDERVRGHYRKFTPNSTFGVASSRSLKTRTNVKFGQTSQGIVWVRPFNRTGRAGAHPFLMPTVFSMRDDIMAKIEATISGTLVA